MGAVMELALTKNDRGATDLTVIAEDPTATVRDCNAPIMKIDQLATEDCGSSSVSPAL